MAFPTLQPWLVPQLYTSVRLKLTHLCRLDLVRDHGFYDVNVIDRARKETYALFDIFEKSSIGRKYFVNDSLSIGDIMVACVIGRACKFVSSVIR